MRCNVWRPAFILAIAPLLSVIAPSVTRAQLLRRENVTLSAGLVYYSNGAVSSNCPEAGGVSAAFDFRTRGAWHVGAGMGLFLAATGPCGGVGVVVEHNGESLNEQTSYELLGAPAIEVHGGRSLVRGDVEVALSGVARLTYGTLDYGAGKRAFTPWLGGRMTLDGILNRLGLGFELGSHRAPVHWTRSDGSIARSFGRWEPMGQLMLRLRPWGSPALEAR